MPYSYTIGCRNWITYLAFAAATAIVLYLVSKSAALIVFLWPLGWAGKCIVCNRTWSGSVRDGMISWQTLFRGRERHIVIADIAVIEIHHNSDDGHYLVFQYRNGDRQRAPSATYKFGEHEAFIAALLEESPTVQVIGPPPPPNPLNYLKTVFGKWRPM